MLRVLHIIETLGRGGAEGLLHTNLSRLDHGRFGGIVCHLYDRDLHWRQPIVDLGYPVHSLHMTSIYDIAQGLARLLRLLNHEPVDIIHTHLYGANLIGRIAGRLTHHQVVSSLHNPDYDPILLRNNPSLSPSKLGFIRFLDRLTCWIAKPDFLAVSEFVKDSATRYLRLPPNRIRVILNPIDVDYFDPTIPNAEHLRGELNIRPKDNVLVCIARYDPQKGLRYLIEAIALLEEQFSNFTAIFIGGGSESARLSYEQIACRFGIASRCRFLGAQRDVRPYLKLCDIFVLPSLFEGLGIALVEAMSMKVPCVATRVSAIPEVVDDGHSGLLVTPADPLALAQAIGRLLSDPALRIRMGEEGRRIALERFNINQNIHQLETLYEQVGNRASARSS